MIVLRDSSPFGRGKSSGFKVYLWLAVSIIAVFALIFCSPLPEDINNQRDAVISKVANAASEHLPTPQRPSIAPNYPTLENTKSKYAFATFLASDAAHPNSDSHDMNEDNYCVATRTLTYQLLHAPSTRSATHIPLIVLVTANVTEAKRERLRQDGAIVWEAPDLKPAGSEWIHTDTAAWQDVMTKLRLWELEQFELICLLDADTTLTAPIDGVFSDPAVNVQHRLPKPDWERQPGDELIPETYVFAGTPEMQPQHHYPPSEAGHDYPNIGYLNAGFFVFKPDQKMLNYYISLMQKEKSFDPFLPEQNLLNFAHRPVYEGGSMPWQHLSVEWNMHFPSVEDVAGGVRSVHDKWWGPYNLDLQPYLLSWRWRMEGYWEAREASLT